MRQATNSPLTHHRFFFSVRTFVQAIPRALDWTDGTPHTPFHFHQEGSSALSRALLGMPYPLRSKSHSRLGEGSVRRLSATIVASLLFMFFFLTPHVSMSARGIGPETGALAGAVRIHVASSTAWKETQVEVRSVGLVNEIQIPAGTTEFRVTPGTAVNTLRNLILPMEALTDGKPQMTFWVYADIRVHSPVVQAARRVTYGSTITADDVRVAETELSDLRVEYLRSSDEAIGKTLRRSLSPGDPLTRDSLVSPLLVHSGEIVRLLLQSGKISLAASVRAEQNGRLGQTIRVRNLDFSRSIKALVTGRGEVRVE